MTVSAINLSTNNVNTNNNVDKNKQTQQTTKKNISKTAIGVGLVGLAALASIGIYIATKGKSGKQIVKPDIAKKGKEATENVQQKMEKIIGSFNEGIYKDAPKKINKLKNGKTTITLGEGSNRTVYVYDKNANPERQINFVNKGYTVNVPAENGAWEIHKVKRHDIKTGDLIIEKYGKEQPTIGTKSPIEETTISKEEKNGLTEFRKHKYIKNDNGAADEETVLIRTMKLGDDTVRTFRKASLKPNESPEWNVQSYAFKNNEKTDRPFWEILTPEQMQKWKSALGL